MRKNYLVLLATILISASSFAQKGTSYIGVGGDLSLPTGDFGDYFKTGVGGYVKAMFGVGTTGQVTLTTGYTSFKEAGDWEDFTAVQGVAPILFGYRHNFNGFFVEPQIGYGIYNYKETSAEWGFYKESGGLFSAKEFIDGFCSVLHVQLLIYIMNMLAYSASCNAELVGNFFV